MSFIGGIFQGIGITQTFFAGREQKAELFDYIKSQNADTRQAAIQAQEQRDSAVTTLPDSGPDRRDDSEEPEDIMVRAQIGRDDHSSLGWDELLDSTSFAQKHAANVNSFAQDTITPAVPTTTVAKKKSDGGFDKSVVPVTLALNVFGTAVGGFFSNRLLHKWNKREAEHEFDASHDMHRQPSSIDGSVRDMSDYVDESALSNPSAPHISGY